MKTNLYDCRHLKRETLGKVAMIRSAILAVVLVILIAVAALPLVVNRMPTCKHFFGRTLG